MDLFERAKQIRNESVDEKNTAWRIGSLFLDIVSMLEKGKYVSLVDLPEKIEPGDLVWWGGTLWRGLSAGETQYQSGTPWPVSGYKEIIIKTEIDGSLNLELTTIKNDNALVDLELSSTMIKFSTNINNSEIFWVQTRRLNGVTPTVVYGNNATSNEIIMEASGSFAGMILVWNIRIYPPI